MEKIPSYIVLLLICILSRLLSSLFYIEDSESLMIASAVYKGAATIDFKNVIAEHSLFILAAKILYLVFQNLAVVFSIIGGVAIFVIFTYTLYLINVPILSLEGVLVGSLIFFNPLFWIASNRYSPDLAGVAILLTAFFYLVPETYKKYDNYKGWFFTGILAGVKISYFPFLIIPCLYSIFVKKKIFFSLGILFIGIVLALLPALFYLSWSNWSEIALINFKDYFSYHNLFIEGNYLERLGAMLKDLWADGIGGFWIKRNFSLIIISVGSASCLIFGLLILLNFDLNKFKAGILVSSVIFYGIWVYIFENPIQNNFSVLPVLSFFIILMGYGIIYFLVNFNFIYMKVLALLFILGNVFLTIVLVVQHTYPSAIAQAKEYVLNKKGAGEEVIIIAPPEINSYFSNQNIHAIYIPISKDSLVHYVTKYREPGKNILIIEDRPFLKISKSSVNFHHNPYINSTWPDIFIYEY